MLTREEIEGALRQLDTRALEAGVHVDLAVYGGAAMVIAFNARQATKDVDAVIRGEPDFLRKAVVEIAQERNWPEDWLNDGVKGFLSGQEDLRTMPAYKGSPVGGLRVYVPSPAYMFAMKAMAMRTGGLEEGGHDVGDIEAMVEEAEINDLAHALAVVESFYPRAQIPAKVRFGVEEIMERVMDARAKTGLRSLSRT